MLSFSKLQPGPFLIFFKHSCISINSFTPSQKFLMKLCEIAKNKVSFSRIILRYLLVRFMVRYNILNRYKIFRAVIWSLLICNCEDYSNLRISVWLMHVIILRNLWQVLWKCTWFALAYRLQEGEKLLADIRNINLSFLLYDCLLQLVRKIDIVKGILIRNANIENINSEIYWKSKEFYKSLSFHWWYIFLEIT